MMLIFGSYMVKEKMEKSGSVKNFALKKLKLKFLKTNEAISYQTDLFHEQRTILITIFLLNI